MQNDNQNIQQFSPAESLQVIHAMLEKTKHSISNSSIFFLIWGYAVFTGCMLQYILIKINYPQHYYAWFITPIAFVVHFFFLYKHQKKEKVKTYASEANKFLWMAVGFAFAVLPFIFSNIGWQHCFPFYILFYGIGTFASGGFLKFKPLVYGGIFCYFAAAACAYVAYDVQMLITACSILVSYIIPGHMLNAAYKNQKN